MDVLYSCRTGQAIFWLTARLVSRKTKWEPWNKFTAPILAFSAQGRTWPNGVRPSANAVVCSTCEKHAQKQHHWTIWISDECP